MDRSYLYFNQKHWDQNTEVHLESTFYDLPGFLNGKNSLNAIELGLLGDVRGQNILHLQCHFGQDTLSLARMGAKVTGVDPSEKAILADRSAPVKSTSYSWSHTFGDIFSALLDCRLRITHFEEYDYSPYNCFNNTVKVENGYQIEGLEGKLPMVFSMVADKAL